MRTFAVFALLAVADATRLVKPAMVTTPAVKGLAKDSAVLTLRGGGMVDQSTWMQAYSVFIGLYGVGFLAAPALVMDQNFDAPYDKYHGFISRLTGVFVLSLLYTWSKMDVAAAFPIAYCVCVISAFLGPLYAELQLETKPAHKAAFLMIPLVVAGGLAL